MQTKESTKYFLQDFILRMFYCICSPYKRKSLQVSYYGLVTVLDIQHMLIIQNICFLEKQTGLVNALHLLN